MLAVHVGFVLSIFYRVIPISLTSHWRSVVITCLDQLEQRAPCLRRQALIMGELMATGKVTPVIDRQYKLGEAPQAIRYLEEGH